MAQPRVIDQLRRKLALLVNHQHFANLQEIAAAIGTTQKTLEGWADYGSNKVTPGLVSKKHYEATIKVFAEAIRKNHSRTDCEAIIMGSANELARYLSDKPRLSFYELVEREAISNKAKLVIDLEPDLPAVKRRSRKKPATKLSVTTSQWFWIEFQTELSSSHTIALQQSGDNWTFCDVDYSKERDQFLLPGLREDGFPDSMQETEWLDMNTFYALQTTKPWPQELVEAIRSNAPIDSSVLQAIADHYSSNQTSGRCLFTAQINVVNA